MASESVLEGIFRLPGAVDLKLDGLGTSSPARIGARDVQIVTPSWAFADNQKAVVVGPALETVSRAVDWGERYKVTGDFWGSVSHFSHLDDGIYQGNVSVGAVVVRQVFEGLADDEAGVIDEYGKEVYEAIDRWWRTVADWIEVIARQNIRPRYSDGTRLGDGLEMWLRHGGQARDVWNVAPIQITTSPINALAGDVWKRILRAASDGRQPPTEYLLLRDSFAANRRGLRRRAVLDAATAAEMALTRLLDQELAGVRLDLAAYVKDRSKHISGRISALIKLGVQLPAGSTQITKGLAEPRNRAIHGGVEPTVEETRTALRLADQVVELALPRAGLL